MKGNLAEYLFHQGTNFNSYDFLGAHLTTQNNKNGVVFRVWAPNAKSVSVVGDFNAWNKDCNPMQKISSQGVWECFIEGVKEYDVYKYLITTKRGKELYKADPYAFFSQNPPETASKVYQIDGFEWTDSEYMLSLDNNHLQKPINIYEVNLGSYKRHDDGSYYTYNELATDLVKYVKSLNYTHVEFMPVSEYPFDGSWGYQVTGYYSITSRFGTPKDFMNLVNAFHKEGIGVIIDWVPAHFPKDAHGLMEFDGKPIYEYQGKDRQENANWGTRIFDLGREEVQSFLISNAVFLFDKFHVDGIRVDAVASMLYLDYDKEPGKWVPNIYGNNKNLEAIAFFHKLNKEVFGRFPYALMIAEESGADVKVTGSIEDGGLGFNFKWNMGWMNDILVYMETDPFFRRFEHNKLTFSLMYSFSENFILPISHDEVVHGKKSLLDKMPGEYYDKFANNRAFLGYMMAHPGKKLTFMGEEFGQFKEWAYEEGLEFFLKSYPQHNKLSLLYKDVNLLYKETEPLYSIDDSWEGFDWIDVNNKNQNLVAFKRKGKSGKEVYVLVSFNGCEVDSYMFKAPRGKYKVILNTDDIKYGGSGYNKKRVFNSTKSKKYGYEGFEINIPKLSCLYFEKID